MLKIEQQRSFEALIPYADNARKQAASDADRRQHPRVRIHGPVLIDGMAGSFSGSTARQRLAPPQLSPLMFPTS